MTLSLGRAQSAAQPPAVAGDAAGDGDRVHVDSVVWWFQRQHQLRIAHAPRANGWPPANSAPRLLSLWQWQSDSLRHRRLRKDTGCHSERRGPEDGVGGLANAAVWRHSRQLCGERVAHRHWQRLRGEDINRMRRWNDFGLSTVAPMSALEGAPPDAAVVGIGVARVLQLCDALKIENCPKPEGKQARWCGPSGRYCATESAGSRSHLPRSSEPTPRRGLGRERAWRAQCDVAGSDQGRGPGRQGTRRSLRDDALGQNAAAYLRQIAAEGDFHHDPVAPLGPDSCARARLEPILANFLRNRWRCWTFGH